MTTLNQKPLGYVLFQCKSNNRLIELAKDDNLSKLIKGMLTLFKLGKGRSNYLIEGKFLRLKPRVISARIKR